MIYFETSGEAAEKKTIRASEKIDHVKNCLPNDHHRQHGANIKPITVRPLGWGGEKTPASDETWSGVCHSRSRARWESWYLQTLVRWKAEHVWCACVYLKSTKGWNQIRWLICLILSRTAKGASHCAVRGTERYPAMRLSCELSKLFRRFSWKMIRGLKQKPRRDKSFRWDGFSGPNLSSSMSDFGNGAKADWKM